MTPDQNIRGHAFNAASKALAESGDWLPLSVRLSLADAVVTAVEPVIRADERIQGRAGWFHVVDGTECAAGHDADTMLCVQGGDAVISAADAVRQFGQALARLAQVRDWAERGGTPYELDGIMDGAERGEEQE